MARRLGLLLAGGFSNVRHTTGSRRHGQVRGIFGRKGAIRK